MTRVRTEPVTKVADAAKTRRIELILREVDSLPTLPVIATRLLSLTASDQSSAKQVIELIAADQALTAKVLAMCRQSDRGLRDEAMTIDKAVVLLGFNAIRNAVLSIKVFEVFENAPRAAGDDREGDEAGDPMRFDRAAFWRHSLAVAILAELIAKHNPKRRDLVPAEAFVCGLLHDLGKVVLDMVLPRAFGRIVELTDIHHGNIADIERRGIGIDHHTAGKRLAEQWQLPHRLQDCIWLHGSGYDTLPRLEHRRMIGLISLADALAREQHVGYSGNFTRKPDPRELADQLDLEPASIDAAVEALPQELEARLRALGLEDKPSRELLLESIHQANLALGRVNAALDRRSRLAARQGQLLEAIAAFHAENIPGRSVNDALNAVVHSAATTFGPGFYAVLYQRDTRIDPDASWLVGQYTPQGEPARSEWIDPPPGAVRLSQIDTDQPVNMNVMGILPWITDYLLESPDLRQVKLLPLPSGWGAAAVLLHDREQLPPWKQLGALSATWGAAVAAASQHDGARRLGEELAQANQALAEAQEQLAEAQSMARLGEMAAGAAHEMNNPLAVIAGRSQLLTMTLDPGTKQQKAAQTIFEQAHRLSDLITALRLFADPPQANRVDTDVRDLLEQTVAQVKREYAGAEGDKPVMLDIKGDLPPVAIDAQQVGSVVAELLHNALQAQPDTAARLTARFEPIERKLVLQVTDDGVGMDKHTLEHAMDPFFSAKPAGRQVGMGLARAKQFVAAHGGQIELRSIPQQGTVATVTLPADAPVPTEA